MTLAMQGGAVSPVTSYVAWEPGVRPSTIGLERGTIGMGRVGTIGHGAGMALGRSERRPAIESMLDRGACLAKHPQTGAWSVKLSVEITRSEVVDVVPWNHSDLERCFAEQVWALRLDPAHYYVDREDAHVELSGA